MQWLQLRGRTWYACKEVPRDLRQHFHPKRRLLKSLETHDHHVALQRRHAALAAFEMAFSEARKLAKADDVTRSALHWKATFSRLAAGDLSAFWTGLPPDNPAVPKQRHLIDVANGIMAEQAHEIAEDYGQAAADRFNAIANGQATPIDSLVPGWLAEADIEDTSKADHQRSVDALLGWMKATGIPPLIEPVDRKMAGRFLSHLLTSNSARRTVRKRLWSMMAFWDHLIAKGYLDNSENPWRGHKTKPGRSERDQEKERPFTGDELRRLLDGPASPGMALLMRAALLSGARISELVLLRVEDVDVAERTMIFRRDPKTPSSRRAVPVHSAIWPDILARVQNRPADAAVFYEMTDKNGKTKPGSRAGELFGRYRIKVGVHDKHEGQRRALTNFHSFRRTFVTLAEQAGIPESTIRSVVGHKRSGVTLGVYSAGPSLDQRRACVEAVRLPA